MIQQIRPRSRAEWLALRKTDITASTVGALFGIHDFITIAQVWAEKTGRLPELDEETDAMRRGRLLEPVAVQILREERPDWQITHNAAENVYYRDEAARLGGTPDVIVFSPTKGRGVVQIKSVEASVFRRKWVVDGEVVPPMWIAVQASIEAYLTGADWAAVAPLVVGFGIEMPIIEIELVPGLIDSVKEHIADFWAMVERGEEPGLDFARDGDLIKALYPTAAPGTVVDLTKDNRIGVLLAELTEAKQIEKASGDRKDEIQNEIKAKLGAAETGILHDGRSITWKTQHRKESVVKASSFRVLRVPTI